MENIERRDLRKELDELNIISFDGSGILTKEIVFNALDVIKEHISQNSDEDAINHIECLKAEKAKHRFSGNINSASTI